LSELWRISAGTLADLCRICAGSGDGTLRVLSRNPAGSVPDLCRICALTGCGAACGDPWRGPRGGPANRMSAQQAGPAPRSPPPGTGRGAAVTSQETKKS